MNRDIGLVWVGDDFAVVDDDDVDIVGGVVVVAVVFMSKD